MVFIDQLQLTHLLEFLAALAGSYYLRKTEHSPMVRYFVWFLWLTVFVELIATYTGAAYHSNYKYFSFIKGTPFAGNYWIYNIYSIIAFTAYICLFSFHLQEKKWRKGLLFTTGIFIFASIVYLFLTDVYFKAHSSFTFILGSLIVLISIGVFYWELLKSDEILAVKRSIHFYISIGALVYHLGFVPLVIYSRYYNMESPEFVKIYVFILYGINYFLYSLYTIGFVICSRKKRSY